MLKAAPGVADYHPSAEELITSPVPAWRFLTAARPGRSSGIFEQFFVSTQKTSAVESSSHAPSRASGRPSRGAAHFFVARGIGRMEHKMADYQNAARIEVC